MPALIHRKPLAGLLAGLLLGAMQVSGPAFAHEPIFGLGPHTIYQFGYGISTQLERQAGGWTNNLEFNYGLTGDWAVTAVVPYNFGRGERPAQFGDLILRTKFRFYRHDVRGASLQAALHLGAKFPTASGSPKTLVARSADEFAALSFGYESRRHYVFSGVQFHRRGASAGASPGNAAYFNLAYGIRPWRLEYLQPDPVFIFEVNGNFFANRSQNGGTLPGTGGSLLSVGPGLLFSIRNVMFKSGLSLPILRSAGQSAQSMTTELVFGLEIHLPPLR